MSKQLILVRHGKSDWAVNGMADFDRPLNHRGHKNAPEMAERLLKRRLLPQQLISSPAKRALSTAQHFAESWGQKKSEIQKQESIYEANPAALLRLINQMSNDYHRIALFGHNPGLTDLVNYLSDAHIYNIPTAGVVVIDFQLDDWAMVSQHTGDLFLFDFPKSGDKI